MKNTVTFLFFITGIPGTLFTAQAIRKISEIESINARTRVVGTFVRTDQNVEHIFRALAEKAAQTPEGVLENMYLRSFDKFNPTCARCLCMVFRINGTQEAAKAFIAERVSQEDVKIELLELA